MDGRRDPATAPSRPPSNPLLPHREDCWSEGETWALVEAWGERYVELDRGNLRQKHWQEVADAVNSRRDDTHRRPPRTDIQCKNRIDTLKKKYKVEKARGAPSSQWPFFSRLDDLIGPSAALVAFSPAPTKKRSRSPPLALPLPFHRKGSSPLPTAKAAAAPAAVVPAVVWPLQSKKQRTPVLPPALALPIDVSFYRRAAAAAAAAEDDDYDDDDDEDDLKESSPPPPPPSGSSSRSRYRTLKSKTGESNGEGIRHLARAMTKFAEVYERVETAKAQQMMELEKQRLEFTKMLEFHKMQLFVDYQVQVEKIKRAKRSDSDNYSKLDHRKGQQAYGDLMQ